jgi:hypothetical protein
MVQVYVWFKHRPKKNITLLMLSVGEVYRISIRDLKRFSAVFKIIGIGLVASKINTDLPKSTMKARRTVKKKNLIKNKTLPHLQFK